MKNNIKVSIIVPCYNAEKHLNECLESIINQTLNDIEIICVNDGSTDGTKKILEEYVKKYSNIKLINQSNKGVNGARITGYNNANGEYIAWVDSDDFIDSNMYEIMYNKSVEDNSDIVICNYSFYPKKTINKEKWFKNYKGINDWKFISKNTIQWNKIVKKTLLDKINIVDLFNKVGEGCYSFVLLSTNNISTINQELYHYRVGHTSLSTNYKNIEWYKNTVIRAKNRYQYSIDNNYDKKWSKFFNFCYLYYVLIYMVVCCYNNNRSEYKKTVKLIKKGNLFSSENKDFLDEYLSKNKQLFFKYIGINNFFITKIISLVILK